MSNNGVRKMEFDSLGGVDDGENNGSDLMVISTIVTIQEAFSLRYNNFKEYKRAAFQ